MGAPCALHVPEGLSQRNVAPRRLAHFVRVDVEEPEHTSYTHTHARTHARARANPLPTDRGDAEGPEDTYLDAPLCAAVAHNHVR